MSDIDYYNTNSDTVESLVDRLDDIPMIMSQMNHSNDQLNQYQVLGSNHSQSMDKVLHGHSHLSLSDESERIRYDRMTNQAKRVIEHLSKLQLNNNNKIKRNISELAKKAINSLNSIDKDKVFSNYDIHKKGMVSCEVLGDILSHSSNNEIGRRSLVTNKEIKDYKVDVITKDDSLLLTSYLDDKNSGLIDYNNIIYSLNQIQSNSIDNSTESITSIQPNKDIKTIKINNELDTNTNSISNNIHYDLNLDSYHSHPLRRFYNQDIKPAPYDLDTSTKRSKSAPTRRHIKSLGSYLSNSEVDNNKNDSIKKYLVDRSSPVSESSGETTTDSKTTNNSTDKKVDNKVAKTVDKQLNKLINKQVDKSTSKSKYINTNNQIMNQLLTHTDIINLRHLLKSIDQSNSGFVNYNELQYVIKNKINIDVDNQLIKQFYNNLRTDSSTSSTSYIDSNVNMKDDSYNDGVSIDKLIDNIQSYSSTPSYNQLHINNKANEIENKRIVKKIVQSMNTTTYNNTSQILQSLDKQSKGYLTTDELKSGLDIIGSNLSSYEYKQFINYIDNNHVNKININDMTNKIHEYINNNNKSNNSYNYPEYDLHYTVDKLTKPKLIYNKLSNYFNNHSKVLDNIFNPYINSNKKLLSYNEIKNKLLSNGLIINSSDFYTIEKKLLTIDTDGNTNPNELVSIDKFCEVIGVPLVSRNNKTEIVDKYDIQSDVGIFQSSTKSQSYNPTYATTMFNDNDVDSVNLKRNFKRKQSNAPIYPHTYEPSKFWELNHSHEDILIPMPLESSRSVNPSNFNINNNINKQIKRSISAPPKQNISSRWANKTLADWIKQNDLNTSTTSNINENNSSTSYLGVQVIPPKPLVVVGSNRDSYINRYGTSETAIRKSNRTLRKQVDRHLSSEPPFALNY